MGDGSNLSSVLHHLTEHGGARDEVLRFVRELPEQNIGALSYVKTPRGEVMVQLEETFGNQHEWRDAALLSDGTLRVLAIAAALLSVPVGTLVVIEEIDNGVHPSRAYQLLQRIQQIAGARRVRIVMTTHNPATLDVLPVEALPDVVACFREPETGASRLQRLSDLDSYAELTAAGRLGQLASRGDLDRYLKHQRTSEERKAESLDWIERTFGRAR
jgi:predicted ATPase